MSFLHPEFLYFMLPTLLLLFAFLLTQKESNAAFFSDEVLQKLRVNAGALSLRARNILFLLMAISMVVALSAPVIPEGRVEVKAKSSDIMIAIDISDSMLAQDLYPNRLLFAKQKALDFLAKASDDRIGVMAFASHSYLLSPLSLDHDAVAFLLRKLTTNSISQKGTNIMRLLESFAKQGDAKSKKYLFILSDGGDDSDMSQEIAFAKEQGITIFALATATQKGAPIKLENGEFVKNAGEVVITKLNPAFASLATKTGGVFVQGVNSQKDMEALLSQMAFEKKELHTKEIERYIPLFYFPLGFALILLLIATSSMSKRQSVTPPAAFLLALFFSFGGDANAALLDFVTLNKAKSAYEQGKFEESAKLYERYAKESDNPAAYFNGANALYKMQKFSEAEAMYKKAAMKDRASEAARAANLGNSYAKQGGEENLQKALESYENSLKLKEDSAVKENLEAVKKALQKMKEQKQEQKSQQNQQQQNEKNKQQQNEQNKQVQNQQKSSQKDEKNSDAEQKNSTQNESQQQNQERDKKSENESKKSQNAAKQNEKKDESSSETNSTKDAALNQKKESNAAQNEQKAQSATKMSIQEEQKWRELLEAESSSFLYRVSDENSSSKEVEDEKPW